MNTDRDFETATTEWLNAGSDATPPHVIDAVLLAARSTPQDRDSRVPLRNTSLTFFMRVAAVIAVVAVVGVAALYAFGLGPNVGSGPTPDRTTQPTLTQPPTSEAEVTELLNGFLGARVGGEPAQQYLNVPEEDIPLLYATTSGAPYERGEFEQVRGTEWPYGLLAFKVRLFAGDTVVEQLFFTRLEAEPGTQMFGPTDGRLGLWYQPDGYGTDIAPTTEDGQPVAVPYNFPDGEVTLQVAHPWVFHDGSIAVRLIPEGAVVRPTTDGGERNGWDELVLIADPASAGTCQADPGPADAEALAESILAYPNLEGTAPVVASAGGAEALMMDVVIASGATMTVAADAQGNLCYEGVLGHLFDNNATVHIDNGFMTGVATGERMRLYLFDVPEGSSMRILAIAIIAPESRFERVVEAAMPVVDSIEFHAP
jgi:hypothetical protein